MPSRRPSAVLALSLAAACLGAEPAASRADEPAPPAARDAAETDEAAAKWLDELKGQIGKQDEEGARAAIQRLVEIWKDDGVKPETKKPVPGHLLRYAKDDDAVAVAVAAIDALAELGAETGAKPVREVLERALKAKQPLVDVYGACLRALKRLADPSKATVDLLVSLLQRKENDVVAKVADAIAGYRDAPGKVRKELMEEVLKVGESVFQAQASGKDTAAVAKWQAIGSSVMGALRNLSGAELRDPVEARAWFNDHKKDAKLWS